MVSNMLFILVEMIMEGMYGSFGDWVYIVGLLGKSGVGGGILVVVFGVMGIVVFLLFFDLVGNSVCG